MVSSPADQNLPTGWHPISEGEPGTRYMGAFRTPLQDAHWTIIGPGTLRDGIFTDYLGKWKSVEKIFYLPPVE